MTDDILDLSPEPLTCHVLRPLTAEDIKALSLPRGSKPSAVKRFRDSHHRVARCIALGYTNVRISAMTGYSQSRLSILQSDPAFQDLIEVYRSKELEDHEEAMAVEYEIKAKAQRVKSYALERMLDKADAEQELDPGEVRLAMDMAADMEDRIGHSKKTANLNLNVSYGDRIENARKRTSILNLPKAAE